MWSRNRGQPKVIDSPRRLVVSWPRAESEPDFVEIQEKRLTELQRAGDVALEQIQQFEVDLVQRYRAGGSRIAFRQDRFQPASRLHRLASSSTARAEMERVGHDHRSSRNPLQQGRGRRAQAVPGRSRFQWVNAGGGWPIFRLPLSELAAHPTEDGNHHELYLTCDDVHATVEELEA
jgi:hypothetical protein